MKCYVTELTWRFSVNYSNYHKRAATLSQIGQGLPLAKESGALSRKDGGTYLVHAQPKWPSGVQHCARYTDGWGFEPQPKPPPMLMDMCLKGQLQQVPHQRWILGSHSRESMQRRSILALKPRVDVTISPKQGYHWPHEKDLCHPKFKKKDWWTFPLPVKDKVTPFHLLRSNVGLPCCLLRCRFWTAHIKYWRRQKQICMKRSMNFVSNLEGHSRLGNSLLTKVDCFG